MGMDTLFRAGSSGFLRSNSTLGNISNNDSEELCSECSECGQGVTSRRIALAKRVLAEATYTFTPCLSINAAKSDKCRNTGALGPLLCMIQSEFEQEALKRSLDTLSFLLLDKANRKLVGELGGLTILLSVFTTHTDWGLLRLALDCICSLTRASDAEKELVWQHPAKERILALLSPKASVPHLLEVMCLVRKLSFRGPPGSLELIEPQVLLAVAALLTPTAPPPIILKCCKLLKFGAASAYQHLPAWHVVLLRLVPLLREVCVVEGVLDVLSSLSEHMACKNMLAVVGGVAPLLPLAVHPTHSIASQACCVLGCLSEGGLAREQLCREPCLQSLLRALAHNHEHPESAVALVYTLTNLAKHSPRAAEVLAASAPQLVDALVPSWLDFELLLGAQQLLQALAPAPVQSTTPSTVATASQPARATTGAVASRATGGASVSGDVSGTQQLRMLALPASAISKQGAHMTSSKSSDVLLGLHHPAAAAAAPLHAAQPGPMSSPSTMAAAEVEDMQVQRSISFALSSHMGSFSLTDELSRSSTRGQEDWRGHESMSSMPSIPVYSSEASGSLTLDPMPGPAQEVRQVGVQACMGLHSKGLMQKAHTTLRVGGKA